MNYSRGDELEADRLGIQQMHDAGFDPIGSQSFFKKLSKKLYYYFLQSSLLQLTILLLSNLMRISHLVLFSLRMGRETHGSSKYIEEENQVHMEEVLQEEETGIRMIILEILATSLLI